MILISKCIVPKGYTGIALYPFVFFGHPKSKLNKVLVNHEKIHLRQQLELLIVLFYIWYIVEFLVRLVQFKNWYMAYKNISFEREAYAKETDFNFLGQRKFWNFLKYLRV